MDNAKDFAIKLFRNHDILLLGEFHGVKTTLDFVRNLIPDLHKNGVTNLVMEFGCYERQFDLDNLIMNSNAYDEKLARDMMFEYNVRFPFMEYRDLYKAAFEFNRTLLKGQKKFRIVNMSYKYKWEHYNGSLDIETARKIFDHGCIDKFRAEIIEKEVLNKKEKALVLTGANHAYTKYHPIEFLYSSDNLCRVCDNDLGHRLYKKYGERITNALVHRPLSRKIPQEGYCTPANGLVEKALEDKEYVGFDLSIDPIGEYLDGSIHALGYENFRLKDFFDNYIYLKKISDQRPCTVDEHFLDGIDFNEVIKNFPDPNIARIPKTILEYFEEVIPWITKINL